MENKDGNNTDNVIATDANQYEMIPDKEVNVMEKDNSIKNLAIDLGSANLKIATKINGDFKFSKIKSKVSINSVDTNYTVRTSSGTYCFGVGDSLIQQDKTKREYIEETVLLASYLMFQDELDTDVIKINLAIGLPLDLYKSQSKYDWFEAKINGMTNKSISGNVNGKDIVVKIVSYKICAEGYSGFIALNNSIDNTTPFIIIDSGFRTTDMLGVNIRNVGSETEFIINNYKTFNNGLLEIYDDIQKQFLNDTSCNYSSEIIEDRILHSPIIKIGEKKVDINNWVQYGRHTVKEVLKTIELSIPDAASRNVYIIGGGSVIFSKIADILYNAGETIIKTETLGNVDQSIYANAVGYYMQLENM